MLAMFRPIFVADTKIIYGYNFVAPLTELNTPLNSYSLNDS